MRIADWILDNSKGSEKDIIIKDDMPARLLPDIIKYTLRLKWSD